LYEFVSVTKEYGKLPQLARVENQESNKKQIETAIHVAACTLHSGIVVEFKCFCFVTIKAVSA